MGKGVRLPINDGDHFVMGDYEFAVSLWSPAQQQAAPDSTASGPFGGGNVPEPSSVPVDDLFGPAGGSEPDFGMAPGPFGTGHVSKEDSLFNVAPEETDPLAALDRAQGSSDFDAPPASPDPFGGGSFSDRADALNQQVDWPDAVPESGGGGMIPDDWDDDLSGSSRPQAQPSTPPPSVPAPGGARKPAAPPATEETPSRFTNTGQFDVSEGEISPAQQQALEKANEKITAELEILKKQVRSQRRGPATEITVDTTLIDALGLPRNMLDDEQIEQINKLVGDVMRECVRGLMQVLGSRSSIKNEFRMNVTTIQPVENNPLKFSANVDDALENMFIKQGNAYKKPIEAVREGFEGIAEHQVAVVAGIRAAFKSLFERFDPVNLEERFERHKKGGLIPGMHKARNWELYTEYYNELVGDMDNSFQYLFGDEFVQAYEDQLRKLAHGKKSSDK